MGAYLRGLKRFRVDAETATDVTSPNEQNVSALNHTELDVIQPRQFRAMVVGGDRVRGMVYDAGQYTLFEAANGKHIFTKGRTAPTIYEMVQTFNEDYGIELPLVDLFYWGANPNDVDVLTFAAFVGLDKVSGTWCNHYVYQQQGVDWELWIRAGGRPLPCRLAIADTTRPLHPRHTVTYQWNLSPDFNKDTFSYRAPSGAQEIQAESTRFGSGRTPEGSAVASEDQ